MTLVLTRPASSAGTGIVTNILDTVIGAGNTVAVDGLSVTNLKSMKWIVTIEHPGPASPLTPEIVSFEVLGLNKSGVDADHTVYARIGDKKIKYDVDVAIALGLMNLNITNNESDILNVCVTRIRTGQQ